MVDRAAVALAFLAPLPVIAAYQGMITAGVLPLALFGPVYALTRFISGDRGQARTESARLTAAATLGGALALLPALTFLGRGLDPVPTRLAGIGLGLTAAGIGSLAGLATTPAPRRLTNEEKRRWTLVETLDRDHARGLVTLFAVTLPAATLLGLLREAPLFAAGPGPTTLPEALLGTWVLDGQLVLPSPASAFVVAIPLSLAPLAVGFLTSPRQAMPIAAGGVGAFLIAPVAVMLDLTVESAGGSLIPLSLRAQPGLDAAIALAPAGAGLIVGAGAMYVAGRIERTRVTRRVFWAATGAALVLILDGWLPAIAILLGVAAAAVVVSWGSKRAPLGAALGLGALAALAASVLGTVPDALGIGALVGIVAGGAAMSSTAAKALLLPEESVRSPKTLAYLAIGASLGGAIAWTGISTLADGGGAFPAPHARGLAAAVEALVTSRGDLLLLWGIAAGALIQWSWGKGTLVGIGFLAGPGIGLLVLAGSLLRALWESELLERARDGFVMRGELGYELLRVHVLVIAVLAGEAIALAAGPLMT